MLRWLTTREYNRFDCFWIGLATLAWHDREWFALVVFIVVGAVLSGFLEGIAKRSPATVEGESP